MKLFLPRTLRRQLGTTTGSEAPKGGLELRTAQESRDLAYRLKLIARDRGVAAAAPTGGTLQGLALLEEVWQRLLSRYLQSRDSRFLHRLLEVLTQEMGDERLQEMLDEFAADFLTITSEAPLDSEVAIAPSRSSEDRQEVVMELLVFWLIHSNPAVGPQISLLHDSDFVLNPLFERFGEGVAELLSSLPALDGQDESLLDLILAQYRAAPGSLSHQLRLLLERWGSL